MGLDRFEHTGAAGAKAGTIGSGLGPSPWGCRRHRLAPGRIPMAEGYPVFEWFFEKAGLACRTTPVTELRKAAGGIGCLTGILERDLGA